MGVAVTGAIYKGLTFNGVDSRDYGVYITGAAVFDAPARAVEFITIPGRNGEYALDHGRWENIEVSYPAGMFADNEADFAQGISEFRNAISSQVGYQRLEDDYNPGEYRLAVYTGGLEVDPADLKAGEFTIKFTCKPQRFLTTGETPVSLQSGDTITNPTPYNAKPLLSFTGAGEIVINGHTIYADADEVVGTVNIATIPWRRTPGAGAYSVTIDTSPFNPGDEIRFYMKNNTPMRLYAELSSAYTYSGGTFVVDSVSGFVPDIGHVTLGYDTGNDVEIAVEAPVGTVFTYAVGTAQSYTGSAAFRIALKYNGTTTTYSLTLTNTYAYDGDSTFTMTSVLSTPPMQSSWLLYDNGGLEGYSTVPLHNMVKYVDFDIGEAYTIENGVLIPINSLIGLGAELAELSPGENEITYDNGIEDVTVTPRWWKL